MRGINVVIVALAASVLALSPSTAVGQDAQPRLSIAAGGGIANPFNTDFPFDFTARNRELSVRGAASRHLAVEGFYTEWEHVQSDVRFNQAIQGPNGFLGRADRLEHRTTHRMRTAGANLLATGGSGRVTVAAGGGIGILMFDRRFNDSGSGCEAAVANLCVPNESTFSSDGFVAQGVAEMDVALARRVQVFGRYLMAFAISDPTFGHRSFGVGVRVALW